MRESAARARDLSDPNPDDHSAAAPLSLYMAPHRENCSKRVFSTLKYYKSQSVWVIPIEKSGENRRELNKNRKVTKSRVIDLIKNRMFRCRKHS